MTGMDGALEAGRGEAADREGADAVGNDVPVGEGETRETGDGPSGLVSGG